MKSYSRNIRTFSAILLLPLALLLLQACGEDRFTGPNYDSVPPPFVDIHQVAPDSTTEDGLEFYFIEEGSGPFEVTSNDQIRVRYTGRKENGEIFESTYANGFDSPRTFRNLTPESKQTGTGRVEPLIDGFRRGLLGMKEGEKRTLVIPPELGYGTSDDESNNSRLKDETLVFDVELVNIL